MLALLAGLQMAADLRQGGKTLRIEITNGDPAVVATLAGQTIWRGIPREWRPWKVAIADLESDRRPEVLIGLYRVTRHASHRIRTIYVYGFDGRTLVPKWRGSRLSRDFIDFRIASGDGGDRVLTVDLHERGHGLGIYAWQTFGFRKLGEVPLP